MKKLNKKGFTLIELLAVIVIMGILMVVAIPAVSRTIENTRKDTYLNTAKQYVNQVKTLWAADGLKCKNDTGNVVYSAAADDAIYYIQIKGGENFLLEGGGNSAWKAKAAGWIKVERANKKNTYYIYLEDEKGHVIAERTIENKFDYVDESTLSRSNNHTFKEDDTASQDGTYASDSANPASGVPTTSSNEYICEEA